MKIANTAVDSEECILPQFYYNVNIRKIREGIFQRVTKQITNHWEIVNMTILYLIEKLSNPLEVARFLKEKGQFTIAQVIFGCYFKILTIFFFFKNYLRLNEHKDPNTLQILGECYTYLGKYHKARDSFFQAAGTY